MVWVHRTRNFAKNAFICHSSAGGRVTVEAYGYVRVSGLGQMDNDGPVRQREAIERLCRDRSLILVNVFEESHTGSDLEGREEFHKMREAMLANGVKTVVCEKIDRMARDIMIQEGMICDFRKHSITLFSATPGEEDLCSNDPTRVLIRQILGSFFEYERKMIELKTRAARERLRARNGKCEGVKEYGFFPAEQAVLERILELRKRGANGRIIALRLNAENIRARSGKPWNPSTVRKILARQEKAMREEI